MIQEIEHKCKLLQELVEDMNNLWCKECKKPEYIREELAIVKVHEKESSALAGKQARQQGLEMEDR